MSDRKMGLAEMLAAIRHFAGLSSGANWQRQVSGPLMRFEFV